MAKHTIQEDTKLFEGRTKLLEDIKVTINPTRGYVVTITEWQLQDYIWNVIPDKNPVLQEEIFRSLPNEMVFRLGEGKWNTIHAKYLFAKYLFVSVIEKYIDYACSLMTH